MLPEKSLIWHLRNKPHFLMPPFLEVTFPAVILLCQAYSVFGAGVMAAKAGTLTFMVGGPEDEFDKAKEILNNIGKNIVYCGSAGSGQAAKICNNMLLAITMVGTAEAMNLGIRYSTLEGLMFLSSHN